MFDSTELFELQRCQLLDSFFGELDHLSELIVIEGGFFAGALNLDKLAASGHDHVHVHIGGDIEFVIEIQLDFVANQSNTDRGNRITKRTGPNF